MKTNRFEKTIRQKLESIEPDFQESDWASMQQYMQANTPPGFWQQYGSWLGYAAAASVTAVLAFLYGVQLTQNTQLTADVRKLQEQIEVIRNAPAPTPQRDTIYVVQKEAVPYYEVPSAQAYAANTSSSIHAKGIANQFDKSHAADQAAQSGSLKIHPTFGKNKMDAALANAALNATSATDTDEKGDAGQDADGTLSNAIGDIAYQQPVAALSGVAVARRMSYRLASRLPTRAAQRATNLSSQARLASATPVDAKGAEARTMQAENVIPKVNLKVPYRFGGGIAAEANGQSKSVIGEVLVAKKFSISAGISWLKVKPMAFFTEKIFRDKNRRDFKQSHPGEVPLALEVFNINVNPTLVQIPLTVAFRNNLKNDWVYYASAGTNINVSAREKISYDCRTPNNKYFNKSFEKKSENPVFSSANVALGIEKSWHPIVVQAEGYLYTYFKPLTPVSHTTGPGVKVKLLYQIGRKM